MNKNKFISLCLAAVMTASAVPTSVLAASIGSSSTDANIGEDTAQSAKTSYAEIFKNNNETQVYLTIDDKDRVVSLPTTVILSGTPDAQGKYIGKYSVGVSGDMSGKKIVKVEPEATASLTQKGKNNVTASIAQDKVSFNTDDFKNKTVTNGSISADSLTAGSWNSNFNFNVSTEVNGVPAGYTLLYKYDLSATKQDHVAAYYCVPNKNTEKIEARDGSSESPSKTITSMISSLNPFAPMTAYAAENTIIESNGVKYTLSDEDTLVITGKGATKENIQADLINYDKIHEMTKSKYFDSTVCSKYSYELGTQANKGTYYADKDSYEFMFYDQADNEYHNTISEYFYSNNFQQVSCVGQASNGTYKYVATKDQSKAQELSQNCMEYAKSIASNYTVSMPQTVVFEDGITSIGRQAFKNCQSLKSVQIANSVTEIGSEAFSGCSNLDNVILPDNIASLHMTFYGCKNLTNIKLPKNLLSISYQTFYSCSNLKKLDIPEGVGSIYQYALDYSGIEKLILPESLSELHTNAVSSCKNLTEVYLGKKVKVDSWQNQDNFLSNCPSLAKITVSASNPNFTSTDNVLYSKDMTKIVKFAPKKSQTSFKVPTTVTKIADYAFRDATNLTDVTIPNSVTSIGSSAFRNLKQGSKIYCQSQTVADLLKDGTHYDSSKTTVVVDASKF